MRETRMRFKIGQKVRFRNPARYIEFGCIVGVTEHGYDIWLQAEKDFYENIPEKNILELIR